MNRPSPVDKTQVCKCGGAFRVTEEFKVTKKVVSWFKR